VDPRAGLNVLENCLYCTRNQTTIPRLTESVFICSENGGSFCLKSCRLNAIRLCLLYVVPVVKRLVCAYQNVTYLNGASMTR
jgi:hypothetical protein